MKGFWVVSWVWRCWRRQAAFWHRTAQLRRPACRHLPHPKQSPGASTMPDVPASGENRGRRPGCRRLGGTDPGRADRPSHPAVGRRGERLAGPAAHRPRPEPGRRTQHGAVRAFARRQRQRTVVAMVSLVSRPDVNSGQVGSAAEGLASAMRDAESARSELRRLHPVGRRTVGLPAADRPRSSARPAPRRTARPRSGPAAAVPAADRRQRLAFGRRGAGVSGPVGGSSTVPTSSGGLVSRGGSGSVASAKAIAFLAAPRAVSSSASWTRARRVARTSFDRVSQDRGACALILTRTG